MNTIGDFVAAQPIYDRSSTLIRPKMLSLTDLVLLLPHASCSARVPENQLPKEAQDSFSLKKLVSESENFSSFFYYLGTVQSNVTNQLEEFRKRINAMTSESEEHKEWMKKTDRKLIFSYLAVGALATACFGYRKKAWAKIKTYTADFKW